MGNTIAAIFFAYRLSLSKDFTENQVNVIIITKKGGFGSSLRFGPRISEVPPRTSGALSAVGTRNALGSNIPLAIKKGAPSGLHF